jgi:protein SCO1
VVREGSTPVKVAGLVLSVALLLGSRLSALELHSAKGLVLKVDAENRTLVVSCDPIPGYMDAMEMPFVVNDAKTLEHVKPGMMVRFLMVERAHVFYAENIHAGTAAVFEPEPVQAGELSALHRAMDPSTVARIVSVGQPVPDFALTDQADSKIHLSQLQGKVVALTFGYSRCPNPAYCLRLSNNLSTIEKRFHDRAGRDLVLLTIMIDPNHDQGATLVQYAGVFKANPEDWHFLTGPLLEIKQVAGMFGMNFWNDEGLLTHTLHTVVIDRQGRLASNIEGNQFTAQQLGDLVETVMDRPR